MIKKFASLIAVVALSGCAASYIYEGKVYNSKEKFQQAIDSRNSDALSTITPLPTPLTQRKLVFAIPSATALFDAGTNRLINTLGRQPSGIEREQGENLSRANFMNIKVFFDAVKKKNIYASTQLIEMQSMAGSFAASVDTDTLYLIEPSQGSGQWYYNSFKNGKQIFAYDHSSPTQAGKVQAFVDAVQAQAIRD